MKYSIVGDVHLIRKLYLYQKQQLIPIFLNIYNSDGLILLGDIQHHRTEINTYLVSEFDRLLKKAQDRFKTIDIVVGNHDKDEDDSLYSILTPNGRKYENIKVYDDFFFDGKRKFLFAPFFSEKVWLEKFKWYKANTFMKDKVVVFGHQMVKGSEINYGDGTKYIIDNLIEPKSLRGFKKVFLGDCHYRQVIGNIYEVGSITQRNFGEDLNKGVVLYDTEKDKVVMHKNCGHLHFTLNIDLEGYWSEKAIGKILDKVESPFVRLVVTGNIKKYSLFPVREISNRFRKKFKQIKFVNKTEGDLDIKKEINLESNNILKDLKNYGKDEGMSKEQIQYGMELLK